MPNQHTKNPPTVEERFWSHVDRSGSCWLWTGKRNKQGYGWFSETHSRGIQSHRFAFRLKHGYLTPGRHVCHRCDTPACVNPDHLFEGTAQENIRDSWDKGRRSQAGERNAYHKLTDIQVVAIRRRYAAGGVYQRELADEYGVHRVLISLIVRGKVWQHVLTESPNV